LIREFHIYLHPDVPKDWNACCCHTFSNSNLSPGILATDERGYTHQRREMKTAVQESLGSLKTSIRTSARPCFTRLAFPAHPPVVSQLLSTYSVSFIGGDTTTPGSFAGISVSATSCAARSRENSRGVDRPRPFILEGIRNHRPRKKLVAEGWDSVPCGVRVTRGNEHHPPVKTRCQTPVPRCVDDVSAPYDWSYERKDDTEARLQVVVRGGVHTSKVV